MEQKPSTRYKLWLEQSGYDLKAAKDSLEDKNFEWSCYQSVQCVEKALKSVLVHAGWAAPKTHKLGILLSMCNRANKYFADVKFNFRKIEAYTFISRYPFVYPGKNNVTPHELIGRDDAQACLKIAENIYLKVNEFISKGRVEKGEVVDLNHYYYTDEEISSRLAEVVEILKSSDKIDVEEIILFGSFAREKLKARTSTLDLLIIGKTELGFIERLEYVRTATKDSEPIVEPLVYTPDEFDYMLNDQREGYIESALSESKVIYKKQKTKLNTSL